MEAVPEVNAQVLEVTEPTVILKNDGRKFLFSFWQLTFDTVHDHDFFFLLE